MARVEKTIDVNVPVRTAYDQWTQFEEFPRFMEGVQQVTQMGDRRLHWKAVVGGQEQEWDAEIREQVPDQKIIWHNTSGAENAGMVTFDQLGPAQTRVHLEMSYDPEGFVENLGDKLGFVSRRVEGDLQRFKEFIEERGSETGSWRGEIHNEAVPGGHTRGSAEWGQGTAGHGNPAGSSQVAGTSQGYTSSGGMGDDLEIGRRPGGMGGSGSSRGVEGGYSGATGSTTPGGPGFTPEQSGASDASWTRGSGGMNETTGMQNEGASFARTQGGGYGTHAGDTGVEGAQGYGAASRGAGMDPGSRAGGAGYQGMDEGLEDDATDMDTGESDAGRRDMH